MGNTLDLKGRGSSRGREGSRSEVLKATPHPRRPEACSAVLRIGGRAELQLQESHFNLEKSRWSVAPEPPFRGSRAEALVLVKKEILFSRNGLTLRKKSGTLWSTEDCGSHSTGQLASRTSTQPFPQEEAPRAEMCSDGN